MAKQKNHAQIISLHVGNTDQYNAAFEKEQNYIGKQIAEARNKKGLSLTMFSRLLAGYGVDVSSGALNKWERGVTTPNAYQLLAAVQALDIDVDFSYFASTEKQPELNAEGLRKVADYKADLIASGRYKPETRTANTIRYIDMPVSNLAVSAGTGAFLDEGNFEMVSFPEATIPAGAEFGIRVSGDSMEPVYHDGQIVWVQRCVHVDIGQVGIFIYDGEGYIKVHDEQEPNTDELDAYVDSYGGLHKQPVMISYNKKYTPRVISGHAGFQVVGKVL